MTNRTTSRRALPLAGLVRIGLLAGIALPARAQAVHPACYVPAVGAVYLILKPGLPTAWWDGDITGVTAGSGLSGGGTTGAVTLSVNTATIQARLSGACAVGSAIRDISSTGTVTCQSTGVPGYEIVSLTQSHAAPFAFTVSSPAGTRVLGGGHDWTSGQTDVWFWQSAATSTGTGWQLRGTVNRGGAASSITAFAICAAV